MLDQHKKSGNRRWLVYFLLLIIALVVIGVFFRNKNTPKGEVVETDFVERRTIYETVSASGRIFPEKEVIMSSDVSGEIVELFVQEGDSVFTGQPLVRIDPEAFLASVQRSRANLNNAKAQLANSNAQIEKGKARRVELVTQLNQANRVHNRNIGLFKEGIISQAEFDESLTQLEISEAGLKSADADIRSFEQAAKAAEYSVASQEATLKEMLTNLNRTNIKAPNEGIISSLSVEIGERVVGTAQMSGTEIMRIADLNTMEVQVEVSENDIIKVSLGDSAQIEVDAYIDRTFSGIVTEIANSAMNIAGQSNQGSLNTDQVTNFIVKVRIEKSSYEDLLSRGIDYPFRPGMSASVDITTTVETQVLSIPIQSVAMRSLGDREGGPRAFEEVVFLFEADSVRTVSVVTGIQDDEFIQIVKGLEEDQEVITGPYSAVSQRLNQGSRVTRKPADKADDE